MKIKSSNGEMIQAKGKFSSYILDELGCNVLNMHNI